MRAQFLILLAACTLLFSCKKETEEYQTEAISDYLLIKPGKYITYRLDSMVTLRAAPFETHSYQEKHQVDALISDNLGRPSYRVFRYLRDTLGNEAWKPAGSYMITIADNKAEVIEDNLRFLKFAGPIKEGNSWLSNRFLPYDTYKSTFDLDAGGIELWESAYAETSGTAVINGKSYNDVVTIDGYNESRNAPVTDGNSFGFQYFLRERYAKNLGLLSQQYIIWEYQPLNSNRPGYRGFGVKRTIIDHN
ncbi:MAG: hypothetical protein EON98_08970 [Chitinophagaceae bacterium]|nr:MAG: hypothetical protein EON98_08970 [Chitinophagaceae bacterium]